MSGWNDDKVFAALEYLERIAKAEERQAEAAESMAESVKIGGPFSIIGQALKNLTDAVHRNTTLGR